MITAIHAGQTPAYRPKPACDSRPPGEWFPKDGVDFTRVDTAQEASQLPVLEPTFQFALVMGLALIMDPKNAVAVSLSSQNSSDGVNFAQTTALQKPDGNGVVGVGTGTMAAGVSETNSLKLTPQGGVVFASEFGDNNTELTIAKSGKATTLTGKIGDVEADLTMELAMDATGMHLKTSGTLGGQPYELTTDMGKTEWTSRGSLNGQEISKTYTMTDNPDGSKVFQGQGTNAGLHQDVRFTLAIAPQG